MNKRYAATLDIYALTATYPLEATALREVTQLTALAYLQRKATKQELLTLLRLAKDLGYTNEELYKLHTQFLADT
jgi:hypothetical protein